jgi:hypothetical protein
LSACAGAAIAGEVRTSIRPPIFGSGKTRVAIRQKTVQTLATRGFSGGNQS